MTEINQEKYMILRNFKEAYQEFNGIDLKIGKRRPNPNNEHKPPFKFNFFIDGLRLNV